MLIIDDIARMYNTHDLIIQVMQKGPIKIMADTTVPSNSKTIPQILAMDRP